jgi:hypothetical protein
MKTKNHATVLETECNRQYYTKHGLHLNGLGKEVLTKQIAAVTENLFQLKERSPISLNWERNQLNMICSKKTEVLQVTRSNEDIRYKENDSFNRDVEEKNSSTLGSMMTRSSSRKKVPKTLSKDFLWRM